VLSIRSSIATSTSCASAGAQTHVAPISAAPAARALRPRPTDVRTATQHLRRYRYPSGFVTASRRPRQAHVLSGRAC
jgi:hypothetical protein